MATDSTPIQATDIAVMLDRIPRVRCGLYPTPLEELTRIRAQIGRNCPRIFIKRDDYTGTGFGSNKLRKLDYAIAREIGRGTSTIVTIAGERSNHARVTAAVCARFGLKCVLVLNRAERGSAPDKLVPASRFVYEMLGAEVHWVGSREEREPAAMKLVEELCEAGDRAAFLPLGVSVPLGAIGFVQAVREVMGQFEDVGARPSHIFHASTSGGTQAGMIAGCRLFAEDEIRVVGVSPDDPGTDVRERIASIIAGMSDEFDLPVRSFASDEITVLDEFIGDGYGRKTAVSEIAAGLSASSEAVILDHTYTAKTFAAIIDWIETGRLSSSDTVLFWHTGGQLGEFYAPINANGSAKTVNSSAV